MPPKGRKPKIHGPIAGDLLEVTEAERLLLDAAVKSSTVSKYKSQALQVLRFARQIRIKRDPDTGPTDDRPLAKDEFTLFLAEALKVGMAEAEGFRSALSHFQLIGVMIPVDIEHKDTLQMRCSLRGDHWAAAACIRRQVDGCSYKGGKAPVATPAPRGAITIEMANAMIESIHHKHQQLRLPLQILTYCGLRGQELVLMRSGDLVFENGGWWLTINCNKGRTAKTRNQQENSYKKLLVMPEGIEAVKEAQEAVPEGQPLWRYGRLRTGGFNRKELLQLVKEAQLELGWDPDLSFVPHSFRHGAVAAITDLVRATGGNETDLHNATQQSSGTRARYSKSNEERALKNKKRRIE